MQATLHHGSPLMVDYVAESAVSAGDVILFGNRPMIAHRDIAVGALGALAAFGGVYRMAADSGGYGPGDEMYWDDGQGQLTGDGLSSGGGLKHFGFIAPESDLGSDGSEIIVIHMPNGDTN